MTDPPAELVALRHQVHESIYARLDGKAVTPAEWMQMSDSDRAKCKQTADPRLLDQLREAEQEWSTALWEQKEATR